MILPDDRPESPSKLDPPASALAAAVPEQPAPPPAYPGHEASTSRLLPGPSEAQPIVYAPVERITRGEPAGKRFCKAFSIAVLVYLLLGALTSSIAGLGTSHGWNRIEFEDLDTAQPQARDGLVLNCIKGPHAWSWEDSPGGPVPKTRTFDLLRPSDVLYFFSRGMHLSGNVVIVQDERINDSLMVKVDVTPLHNTYRWLHAVSVCSLARNQHEMGLGIFAPTQWRSPRAPELEFEVVIRLPKIPDEVLQIPRLETVMPFFTQHLGELNGTVLFRELSLKSVGAHIFSQSVDAVDAEIITTTGHIHGHYQASKSLTLSTTNQPINVTATLVYRDPDDTHGPVLKMRTSNAKIDSFVNLVSIAPHFAYGHDGVFTVEANTTNARLSLDFLTAPVDSKLNFVGRTSNSNARVWLHPTFEGSFAVQTSNHAAVVDDRPTADPSGRNRKREVTMVSQKWAYARGMAMWKGEHLGHVELRTSNGRAELHL